jgi:N-acetylmuramoyl-L-alanine amidase
MKGESTMPKIYISPAAHAGVNKCVYNSTCTENIHCNLFADELEPYLKACGIEYRRAGKQNTGDAGMMRSVAESNAWRPDIHYTIHSNAGGGTYSMVMIYAVGGRAEQYAQVMLKHRKAIYPWATKVVARPDLYELNATTATALYEELTFHDHKECATWLHKNLRPLAEKAARAFCEILGLSFKDPYQTQAPPSGKLYRVQVGAFAEKRNAEKLLEKIKSAGFDGFIRED